jgi:hypothetical protein
MIENTIDVRAESMSYWIEYYATFATFSTRPRSQ